jgi:hypothetical protein
MLRKSIFATVGADMLATIRSTIPEKMRNVPRCKASMMMVGRKAELGLEN